MILTDFRQHVLTRCGLVPDRPVVVGVSGGADSLCLLNRLADAGFPLVVACFDHGLRPDSGQDVQFVAEVAAARGLTFVTAAGDVEEYRRAHSLSIEEAARLLRYGFLFETARRQGAQAVAVGHTADDQVETVLMHLLRGAGLAGLKGMLYRSVLTQWDTEIPLVRPLLDAWRTDTVADCLARDLTPLDDESNRSPRFFRNRLRLELIPLLETYHPAARRHILQTAQSLQEDHDWLETQTEAALESALVYRGDGFFTLDATYLAQIPPPLAKRLLRQLAVQLQPDLRDLDYRSLEAAAAFLQDPAARRLSLPDHLELYRFSNRAYLVRSDAEINDPAWPLLPEGFTTEVVPPCDLTLPGGWTLVVEWVDLPADGFLPPADPFEAWLVAERISNLELRSRRAGDRFQPLGMQGTQKLSDFFINAQLPAPARAGWPLLVSGDRVAWVPGFRPAEWARLTPNARRALRCKLNRPIETGR